MIYLMCGLRNEQGEEIHTYIPREKIGLGKEITLKNNKDDSENIWKIFGICSKIIEKN